MCTKLWIKSPWCLKSNGINSTEVQSYDDSILFVFVNIASLKKKKKKHPHKHEERALVIAMEIWCPDHIHILYSSETPRPSKWSYISG